MITWIWQILYNNFMIIYLSVQHDFGFALGNHWVQRASGIKYVSAGVTGVWGININDRVVYRGYDDTSFTSVSGKY